MRQSVLIFLAVFFVGVAAAEEPSAVARVSNGSLEISFDRQMHRTLKVGDCFQVPMDEWRGASVPQAFESAIGKGSDPRLDVGFQQPARTADAGKVIGRKYEP